MPVVLLSATSFTCSKLLLSLHGNSGLSSSSSLASSLPVTSGTRLMLELPKQLPIPLASTPLSTGTTLSRPQLSSSSLHSELSLLLTLLLVSAMNSSPTSVSTMMTPRPRVTRKLTLQLMMLMAPAPNGILASLTFLPLSTPTSYLPLLLTVVTSSSQSSSHSTTAISFATTALPHQTNTTVSTLFLETLRTTRPAWLTFSTSSRKWTSTEMVTSRDARMPLSNTSWEALRSTPPSSAVTFPLLVP